MSPSPVVVVRDDPTWPVEFEALRDFLRANPARAAGYAALKQSLAARFQEDREGDTRGKSDLIAAMLADAVRAHPTG